MNLRTTDHSIQDHSGDPLSDCKIVFNKNLQNVNT